MEKVALLVAPDGEEIATTPEEDEPSEEQIADWKRLRIPVPVGYRMLIAIPDIEEVTEGGIHKPTQTIENEKVATLVGHVLAMGPDCYTDEDKFSGPWCEVGDFVVIRAFSGSRLAVDGIEFRIITDDTVEAVVNDPRGIRRV